MSVRNLVIYFLLFATSVRADDGSTELVKLNPKISGREVELTFLIFSEAEYRIRVIDNGKKRDSTEFENLKDAILRSGCVAGVNGGFFDVGNFTPLGLVVSDGKYTGKFDPNSWMKGVFSSSNGIPRLSMLASETETRRQEQFLQSGDWLVFRGQSTVRNNEEKRRRRRTFIGNDGKGRWIIGCCDSAKMNELSELMRSPEVVEIIDLDSVLNLDGGPSTGFVFLKEGAVVAHVRERWIVRNFIGVRKRILP